MWTAGQPSQIPPWGGWEPSARARQREQSFPSRGEDASCLNTDTISRWSDKFDWNRLHIPSMSMGQVQVHLHHPPLEQPQFSCTPLSQTNSKERAWGTLHTQKNSKILHPTAALTKLEETEAARGYWRGGRGSSSSFREVLNGFLGLCLSISFSMFQAGTVQLRDLACHKLRPGLPQNPGEHEGRKRRD